MDLPPPLREALDAALAGAQPPRLAAAVARLISRYRDPEAGPATDEAILAGPADVTAYAAYRMPATYAAVRAALTQVARVVPGLRPVSLLDLGGGTGAAAWAAVDVFPGVAEVTVLDRVPAALELGARLGSSQPVLRSARWVPGRLEPAAALPHADLVTLSYVLGELAQPAKVVSAAAAVAGAVVVVEPGTPAGYGRVLAARDILLAAGLRVVAPCPHAAGCPLVSPDWCHFAVRVNRSALHRRVKEAILGYEDEKFSYVAAVRNPVPDPRPGSRVLRHPRHRKGLVQLRLCTPAGTAATEIVSKRQGDRYRAARDVSWGDAWPQDPTDRSDFRVFSEI